MKTIGIIVNTSKPNVAAIVSEASDWLRSKGIRPLVPDEQAAILAIPTEGFTQEQVATQSDMLIVLGGDGTILNAAHIPFIEQVPILGVNIGHLGYLTEVALTELYPTLTNILNGNYEIHERMMLQASLHYQGVLNSFPADFARKTSERMAPHGQRETKIRSLALNDVFIKHPSRMIKLETYIDGEYFITYNSDGLIIATPTGSTAYSLSVGGPIVEPRMDAIILSPIASHALTVRPFIAHPDSQITVFLRSDYSGVILAVDHETWPMEPDCVVTVCKADKTIKLIKSKNRSYYEVLRSKLRWGERGE